MIAGKILQIIPTRDWGAIYLDEDAPYWHFESLACWALVKHRNGTTTVEGMDGYDCLGFVADSGNFLEYRHRANCNATVVSEWMALGKARAEAPPT